MRDHTKLRAFELADMLTLEVYKATRIFPKEEQFCLTSQLRRAAISITSNIVEGCARNSDKEFLHFLNISFASLKEVEYQLSLAFRLEYLNDNDYKKLKNSSTETSKVLAALIRSKR